MSCRRVVVHGNALQAVSTPPSRAFGCLFCVRLRVPRPNWIAEQICTPTAATREPVRKEEMLVRHLLRVRCTPERIGLVLACARARASLCVSGRVGSGGCLRS